MLRYSHHETYDEMIVFVFSESPNSVLDPISVCCYGSCMAMLNWLYDVIIVLTSATGSLIHYRKNPGVER